MNETQKKFGDPGTRVKGLEHWVILLREKQVTLGSLVLVSTQPARAFSEIDAQGFAEFHEAVAQIERGLKIAFAYDKINYLMLMMVDPDVHMHVIPRYAKSVRFAGHEFCDSAWPGPPDLAQSNRTDAALREKILAHLQSVWQ